MANIRQRRGISAFVTGANGIVNYQTAASERQ
jgi:hypothetical protein